MKKIGCLLALCLLFFIGCGKKSFEIEQLEEDIISQINASSFEFLDDIIQVELEEDIIRYSNKITYDHDEIRTIQDIDIKYRYDKKKREWMMDSCVKNLDHYIPLVDAIKMQGNLKKQLGFEEEILIGDDYIKLDDKNLSINQMEIKFDGNNYSDYIYEIFYDNGAVNARANYKITFFFVDSRGEWILEENQQTEDFVLNTNLITENENALDELVKNYITVNQHGLLDLIGDDSNMSYKLSMQDEDMTLQRKSDMIVDGLYHSFIDIQVTKKEGPVHVDTVIRVDLKLDEYNRVWEVTEVKPLVNQTSIRLSDAFIGIWEGYFNIQNHRHKALLNITSIISDGARFEGLMSFGSSDTYVVEDSSYAVLGGFVKDELLIECAQWIIQAKGVKAYTIYIDDITFMNERISLSGNMTWQNTDDYKAEFVKSSEN